MTSKDLSKYILVIFQAGGNHRILATSDCLEELEHHRKIHGLQGFTQIINSQNFKKHNVLPTPRQNSKQANVAGEKTINWLLNGEEVNERT